MLENGGTRSGGQDALVQGAVLLAVLEQFPERPTIFGLAVEINGEQVFAHFDVVERAVRDLVGKGLLRCRGESLTLTRMTRMWWRVHW
jgi:hypothetical protein